MGRAVSQRQLSVRSSVLVAALLALLVPLAAIAGPSASAAPSYPRVMPLPDGQYRVSTLFGVAGPMWSSGYHTGLDLGASDGTAVLSAADGTIVETGDGGAYGNLTKVRHIDGVETWYAHQSRFAASTGATVKAGQVIGHVGSTGNTTGPHLHFEVRVGGQTVDPSPWLAGAATVAGPPPSAGAGISPEQWNAELMKADAAAGAARAAAQRATRLKAAAHLARKESAAASASASRHVRDYARNAYMGGAEPNIVHLASSLDSGDLSEFTDRQRWFESVGNSASRQLDVSVSALESANALLAQREKEWRESQDASDQAEAALAAVMAADFSTMPTTGYNGPIPAGGSAQAVRAVKWALTQVGGEYAFSGGKGPSYGCNDFVWKAWNLAGSGWPLVQAHDQATDTSWVVPVPAGQEKPGDLIFWRFNNGTDSRPGALDHVGLVVNPDSGAFVHSGSTRTGINVSNYKTVDFYSNVAQFGRVIR